MLKERILLDYNQQHSTDCDNCILKSLHLHSIQIDKNKNEFSQTQQRIRRSKEILEQLAAIILAVDGQVQFITKGAEKLLNQYFSFPTPNLLPTPLQYWFKNRIAQLTANGKPPSPCLPLHIEQAGQQLVIRLISNPVTEQYLLLLEEQETQSFSVSSLELLGLTKREAEVLFWVAKDKSNAAIAKVLGCCEGTVRKHLEHLYEKLGVQTRMGAVMIALEKLGLLQG